MSRQRLKQTTLQHLITNPAPESQYDEEFQELLTRHEMLQNEIDRTELYLFQQQKSLLPQPKPFSSKYTSLINDEISQIGSKVIMHHKHARLEERLRHYLKCFGVVIQEYSEKMCKIVFNVEIEGNPTAVYVMQFIKSSGSGDWKPNKYHLPPDFRLDEFSEYIVMSVKYLRMMHEALKAYHLRRFQIKKLKDEVPSHVQVYECLNGKKVEIFLQVIPHQTMNKIIDVVLILKYSTFESRPCDYTVSLNKMTSESKDVIKSLTEQFEGLMSAPLNIAFGQCIQRSDINDFYCPNDEELHLIYTRQDHNRYQEFEDNASIPSTSVPRKNNALINLDDSDESDDDGFSKLRKMCSEQNASKKKKPNNIKKTIERNVNMPQHSDDENEDYYDHSAVARNKKPLKDKNLKEITHQGIYDPSPNADESSVYVPNKKVKKNSKTNRENKLPAVLKKSKNEKSPRGRPKGSKNSPAQKSSLNNSKSIKKPKKTKK